MVNAPTIPKRYVSKFNIYTSAVVDEKSKTFSGFVFTILTPIVVVIYGLFLTVNAATTVDTTTEVLPTASCVPFEYTCTSVSGCKAALGGLMKPANNGFKEDWENGEDRLISTCPGFENFLDIGANGWDELAINTKSTYISIFMATDVAVVGWSSRPSNLESHSRDDVVILRKSSKAWEVWSSIKEFGQIAVFGTVLYNVDNTGTKLQRLSTPSLEVESVLAQWASPEFLEVAPLGPQNMFLGRTRDEVVPFKVESGSISLGVDTFPAISYSHIASNPYYFSESGLASCIHFQIDGCSHLSISMTDSMEMKKSERKYDEVFGEEGLSLSDLSYCTIPFGTLSEAHMLLVGKSKVALVNMNDLTTTQLIDLPGAERCSSNGTHAFVTVSLFKAGGDASPLVVFELQEMKIVATGRVEVRFVAAASDDSVSVLYGTQSKSMGIGTIGSDLKLRIADVNGQAVGSSTSPNSAFGLGSITRKEVDGTVTKSVNVQQGSVALFSERPCTSGTYPSCLRLNVVSTEVVITENKRDALSVVGTIGGFVGSVQLVFGVMKYVGDKILHKREEAITKEGATSTPGDVESDNSRSKTGTARDNPTREQSL